MQRLITLRVLAMEASIPRIIAWIRCNRGFRALSTRWLCTRKISKQLVPYCSLHQPLLLKSIYHCYDHHLMAGESARHSLEIRGLSVGLTKFKNSVFCTPRQETTEHSPDSMDAAAEATTQRWVTPRQSPLPRSAVDIAARQLAMRSTSMD